VSVTPEEAAAIDERVFIRLETALSLSDDGPTVAELVGLFIEDGVSRLELARDAVRIGDLAVLARTAHSFKGSASMIGATRLRGVAAAIENQATMGEVTGIAALLDTLAAEFDRVQVALRALLGSRINR
jgi:HPt (histidine-containing phosphotransfer) domain-containing protein